MTILDSIPFRIDADTVFAHLRLAPGGAYADEINELLAKARRCARPRALYAVASVTAADEDGVIVTMGEAGGNCMGAPAQVCFKSRLLRINLASSERVFLYLATCGPELDSIPIARDDIFSQFCLDAIKELALYCAFAHLTEHLRSVHRVEKLASMNPGSGDQSLWPIEQQKELFALLGSGPYTIGVSLTDSCLMIPNKTVSGLFYECDSGFESCRLCRQQSCLHRRAAFDPALWEQLHNV